jgi:hypothetical protein
LTALSLDRATYFFEGFVLADASAVAISNDDSQTKLPQLADAAAVPPAGVFLRQPLDQGSDVPGNPRPSNAPRVAPFPIFDDSQRLGLRREDPDDVADVMI